MDVSTVIVSCRYTVSSGYAVIVTTRIVVIHVVSLAQAIPSFYCLTPLLYFKTLWKAASLCHEVATYCNGYDNLATSFLNFFFFLIYLFSLFTMLLSDAVQLLPSSYLNLPSNPLLRLCTAIAIQLTHVVQPYSCSFSAVSFVSGHVKGCCY